LPAQIQPPAGLDLSISLLANAWRLRGQRSARASIAGIIPPVVNSPPRWSRVNQRTVLEQWVKPWHYGQGFTKSAALLPAAVEVPPRIIVTPNADRSVTPGADRILIVYAPRTVS